MCKYRLTGIDSNFGNNLSNTDKSAKYASLLSSGNSSS